MSDPVASATGMHGSGTNGTPAKEKLSPDSILNRREKKDVSGKIKYYDFRRPDKFTKDQIRTICNMHMQLARQTSSRFSTLLRKPCELYVEFVDQMNFDEFMKSVPYKSAFGLVALSGFKGQQVLFADKDCSDILIDRLLGGQGKTIAGGAKPGIDAETGPVIPVDPIHPSLPNHLTEADRATLAIPLGILAGENGKVWSTLTPTVGTLDSIENEGMETLVMPPTMMIVIVGLEMVFAGRTGRFYLVYGYGSIEPIVPKLTAKYWYSSGMRKKDKDSINPEAVRRLPVPSEIMAPGPALSIAEIRALKPGSLIPLSGLAAGKAVLRSGGVVVAALDEPLFTKHRTIKARLPTSVLGAADAVAGQSFPGTSAVDGKAGLESRVAELGSSLASSMEKLAASLTRLEARQEALADRMLFGHNDEAGLDSPLKRQRPFSFINAAKPENVAAFLGAERAGLVALVLSHLEAVNAGAVLAKLPPDLQVSSVQAMADMDAVLPAVLEAVEPLLARSLSAGESEIAPIGGIRKIADMLNLANRETEREVIFALEKTDPELAENVKRSMFTFEDLIILTDEALDAVIQNSDERDILAAMKGTSQELADRLFSRFAETGRMRMKDAFEALGRVRLSEVDAAGLRVVSTVKALEDQGRIDIVRGES